MSGYKYSQMIGKLKKIKTKKNTNNNKRVKTLIEMSSMKTMIQYLSKRSSQTNNNDVFIESKIIIFYFSIFFIH